MNDATSGHDTIVLPDPIIRGSTSNRCISDIMRPREPKYEQMFHSGQETLGHFYLPPFQRAPAWTEAQSARLIESIHLGISIGSITVTGCREVKRAIVDGKTIERFPIDSDWLIDGQQRLRAIRAYMADELVIFVGTQHEHRWSQLTHRQHRRFENTGIGFTILGETDVEGLKAIYDLMNFGGTAHTEDQRASGQVTA